MPQPTTINPPQKPRTTVLTDATGVNAVTTDGLGNLNVNVQAGGGGGGGNPAAAPTGAPVPVDADYIGAKDSLGNLIGLSTDVSGNLNVNLAAGTITGGNAAASATGGVVPASADYTGFNKAGNLVGVSSTNPLPVDGSGVTQPVSGTVSVSNFPATQPVSGSVSVSNFPATQPVSGTVTGNQGTPAVTANAWPIIVTDGTNVANVTGNHALKVSATAATDTLASGSLASGGATVQISAQGLNTVGINVAGTWVGTILFEGSIDGTTFVATTAVPVVPAPLVTQTTANGQWLAAVAGFNLFRVRMQPFTSGSATINLEGNPQGTSVLTVIQPSAANLNATVSGSVSVSNFPATQPVSGTVTTTPPANASTNVAQVAGTTTDTNSGLKSAGTMRVVLATDQPALTNKLLVTPDTTADTVGSTVALNALNAAASVALAGNGGVGMILLAGTLIGTIVPEISYDGGTTWVATLFYDPVANTTAASIVFGSANTVTSRTILAEGGVSNARVRVSVFTSGTANCTLRSTTNAGANIVNQGAAPWSVSVSNTPAVTLASTTITGTVASTQSTSPWVDNITQVASTVLGVPQTFGTAPTGVVIGTSSDMYIAGTRARSNQTTTAAGVQDVNIVGTLGATNSVTNGTFAAITDNTTKVGVIAGTTALKTDLSSVAGTATVTAAAGVQKVGVVGNTGATVDATLAAGAAPTNGVAQLVQYNSTAPSPTTGQTVAAQSDIKGSLLISNEGRKATYAIAQQGLTPAAGGVIVLTLYGSATKTVKITRVMMSLTVGTAVFGAVTINKYSTAPTLGTKTSPAMVPYDASDAAATATNNNAYTAAPTAGTLIGAIASERGLMSGSTGTITGNCQFIFDFGGRCGSKPITLSGITQGIGIVVAGAAQSVDYAVEWTEE